MRVLLLHDPYKPVVAGSIGGEDNIAQLEVDLLQELGHEVIDGRFIDIGIKRKLNQIKAQTFGSSDGVLDLISKSKPDVIHTHNLNQRSGYQWMTSTKIPIVSTLHNYRAFCPASIAWRSGSPCMECRDHSAKRAIINRCDGTRGILNASRHLIFQRNNPQISQPKIFIILSDLMGSTLESIIPKSKLRILRSPSAMTQSLKSEKRKGWIFAGRLSREKGILDLITVWPENENLDIAGDGPLIEEVRKIIQNKPNIRLLGTYAPGDISFFQNYEGLIFSSTWFEGSPLVTVESFSAGTPVICTDQSGASEQVDISKGGVVIKNSLTKAKIIEAQKDIRSNFKMYSMNARNSVINEFSIKNWGINLEKYLQEAIN
jgi:glycosyltransferase involved in cell wall biosynthesis